MSAAGHGISIRLIIEAVSAALEVSSADIVSPNKSAHIVRARKMVCFLARRLTGLTTPAIGRHLGGRDHSTIIHAANAANGMIDTDLQFASTAQAIETTLITHSARIDHSRFADADAVETARMVMRQPMRNAMRVSINGVTAMAALLIDMAEIIEGMEEFFAAKDAPPSKERDELLAALEPVLKSCIRALGYRAQIEEKANG